MNEGTHQPSPERVRRSIVPRPGEFGVDLPAGKSAAELDADDYRVIEIEPEPGPDAPPSPTQH
jgi:hypothetical protein